jgi:hypothetical protein
MGNRLSAHRNITDVTFQLSRGFPVRRRPPPWLTGSGGRVGAVKDATSVHHGDATPVTPPWRGTGRPPKPGCPEPPITCKALVIASDHAELQEATWRHGSKTSPANPVGAMI